MNEQTNKCRQTEWQTDKIKQSTQQITWTTAVSEKLTGLQLVKKLLAFYQTKRFITRAKRPQPPISLRSILVSSSHLCLLPKSKFPSGFQSVCHMTCQVAHQYISLLSECQCTLFLVNFVVISVHVDGVLHNDTTIWAVLVKKNYVTVSSYCNNWPYKLHSTVKYMDLSFLKQYLLRSYHFQCGWPANTASCRFTSHLNCNARAVKSK